MPRKPPKLRAADIPVTLSREEIELVRSLVILEDEDILVLNKPSGLSSQGGRAGVNTLDEMLWAFAKKSGRRPVLVHRLDRDTSGIILCAKSKPSAGFLGKAITAKQFEKTYVAIVSPGPPEPRNGEVNVALYREEIGREAYMRPCSDDHPKAEASRSLYRTLAVGEDAALMELRPYTGRMHQLRVHMAHLGRPIVGDARYGGALTLSGRGAGRVMLHAGRLSFPHPAGGRRTVEAPPPTDFQALAEAAGLIP